jgi:UPF0271 protein
VTPVEIDLNCDLGEGCPFDAELMPFITSANVCCGTHAGDDETIRRTLALAEKHGVQVGAHPGFADREHFGRRELPLGPDEVGRLCAEQVLRLGPAVRYIKPHGALYHMACRDAEIAAAIVGLGLPVMALPGSAVEAECVRAGVPFIAEGFADRRYLKDGSLVPRGQSEAFVESPDEAVQQARRLIATRHIRTLCVHGDNPEAVAFVRSLREALQEAGFAIRPFRLP